MNISKILFVFILMLLTVSPKVTSEDDLTALSISSRESQENQAKTVSVLSLDDVLESSGQYAPTILEAIANARGADGGRLAAEGAFDVNISASGFSRVTGFWDGQVIGGEARQNLGVFGSSVYAGYRISDGEFPVYEDINFTNTLGEAKVGALFSLLRNRDIDGNRFALRDTRLALEQAELDVLLSKVSVQRQAMVAYWSWVTAGQQQKIYARLLDIALEREKALQVQVNEGAIADIFLLENRQNITRRQTLLTSAERLFQNASIRLGFYLRDTNGQMRVPQFSELPAWEAQFEVDVEAVKSSMELSNILRDRPELRRLRLGLERLRQKITLRQNDLKPKLDFNVELSHDFGNIAEGDISRDSTDTIVGFQFSIPLGQRSAKGRLKAAKAERTAMMYRERRIQDQISTELEGILVDITAANELLDLASVDVQQSRAMQEAEEKRFANGASDFFLLNIREETAANAEIRKMTANLEVHRAYANYAAATMNTKALGINQ
ncbi:TolC family protein [Kordiimonas sp. SCSIO 12610]|uniref:TolC family protein n=1 Tax=Kordiimonas sp. SCSIO 12610 TaxID=2829597 RepID=UPI00210E777E|nr:TolC family protein [Kordiimonas sp. SCSIO 12610]UTW55705.1 TolC family protein [Kordiimonas sp. SCSIO 12610]